MLSPETLIETDRHKPADLSHRSRWLAARQEMERQNRRFHPRRAPKPLRLISRYLEWLRFLLRWTGLLPIGRYFALRPRLREITLSFPDLPAAFDGFRILHITDPHFDALPGIEQAIVSRLPATEVDVAVLTGDYRNLCTGPHRQILEPLEKVLSGLKVREGVFATLGNHDPAALVADMESLGVRVLTNETVTLSRGEQSLHLVGLDDVHCFYTPAADQALKSAPPGFKVLLVHSNEFSEEAAREGYRLYLCGHTHGGQICLPFGIPLITHSDRPRRMARGRWRLGDLAGYTSPGAGVVSVPVRFFCRGEITVFTLRRDGR